MADILDKTDRSRIRRYHERGAYDKQTIHAILDASPLCHVGYVIDGKPIVMPTIQWRVGDTVYWHGSSASRGLRNAEGADVCLTVSHLDGFVLAQSAFSHSTNYRSVMIFGQPTAITDRTSKTEVLKALIDGLFPDRWDALRAMTEQELKATTVLAMPIDEASAKIRNAGPSYDADAPDMQLWTGVIPVQTMTLAPEADDRSGHGSDVPSHVKDFRLGG